MANPFIHFFYKVLGSEHAASPQVQGLFTHLPWLTVQDAFMSLDIQRANYQ